MRCSRPGIRRMSITLDPNPASPSQAASWAAPSALVRAETPMKKCGPASHTSPPSTVPGAVIASRSGNHRPSAAPSAATSPARLGGTGPGENRAPAVTMAASSTKVLSGNRESGASRTSESPSRSSVRQ